MGKSLEERVINSPMQVRQRHISSPHQKIAIKPSAGPTAHPGKTCSFLLSGAFFNKFESLGSRDGGFARGLSKYRAQFIPDSASLRLPACHESGFP